MERQIKIDGNDCQCWYRIVQWCLPERPGWLLWVVAMGGCYGCLPERPATGATGWRLRAPIPACPVALYILLPK